MMTRRIVLITLASLLLTSVVWETLSYSELKVWKFSSGEIRLLVKPWNYDKSWIAPYGLLFPRVIFQYRNESSQSWREIASQIYRKGDDVAYAFTEDGLMGVVEKIDNQITIRFNRTFAESFDSGKTWKVEKREVDY